MPSLKDLRNRIKSVKNTQQITKTMKLVAAAKVRKARERCDAAKPYAVKIHEILLKLANSPDVKLPSFLLGKNTVKTVRLVVIGSDRGLCGAFNAGLCKDVTTKIKQLDAAGKTVELVCIGTKIHDMLKVKHKPLIIDTIEGMDKGSSINLATEVTTTLINDFSSDACDEVIIYYNRFISMIKQQPTAFSLMPLALDLQDSATEIHAEQLFEPNQKQILDKLLPHYISTQLFQGMLESMAAEHAARMAAMENATKNAGDMIADLSLKYNRTRQAAITTELIEIVAGAEAL